MKRAGFLQKLLMALVFSQLVACGGGSSSKSSSKKIPDAYRADSTSSTAVAVKADSDKSVGKTGVLNLSWSAPSTRTDGEPLSLSDIGGYRLYYGKQKGDYVQGANIKDGSAQSATVTGVPLGTYYVVLITIDSNGVESDYSSAVRKTVKKAVS
jgi:hypothetical protein